jgi:hypothetical protein
VTQIRLHAWERGSSTITARASGGAALVTMMR